MQENNEDATFFWNVVEKQLGRRCLPQFIKNIFKFEGLDSFVEINGLCSMPNFSFEIFLQRLKNAAKDEKYIGEALNNNFVDYFGNDKTDEIRWTFADESKVAFIINCAKSKQLFKKKN